MDRRYLDPKARGLWQFPEPGRGKCRQGRKREVESSVDGAEAKKSQMLQAMMSSELQIHSE